MILRLILVAALMLLPSALPAQEVGQEAQVERRSQQEEAGQTQTNQEQTRREQTGQVQTEQEQPPLPPVEDPLLLEVLEKINSVSAYEVPDLGLKEVQDYARTPDDVEPFGGITPFKDHFLLQMEYTGPGRAIPEPEDLETVKLGFIGPIMSTVSVATGGASHEEPMGIQMLRGARLAIEEANARGGYLKRGLAFELVVVNDNGLWGSSGNEIVKLAYRDGVWGILGTIDGANSHIAIRVALKAEVVMINSGDTDPTFIETNIPWVARVIGDDRQMGYLLADYLYRKLGYERIGIIRSNNRYGRFGVRELRDSSRRLGHPIALEINYLLGSDDFSLQLERLTEADVDAIVHWGDAEDGARVLNQMRAMGMAHPFYASDRCISQAFVEIAGDNAEGVVCPSPWDPQREDERLAAFRAVFRERFGVDVGTYAAHGYDGMNMLIHSVQLAGLNRAKIRDVLAHRSVPWPGVTGDIPLSAALDDDGEVFLARFESGEWRYYSREDLAIPTGLEETEGAESPGSASEEAVSAVEDRGADTTTADDAASNGSMRTDVARPLPTSPHYRLREHQTSYNGPGRSAPEPEDVEEVALGYFGPSDPNHPDGGDMWRAAGMAISEANEAGGYAGLPFRLLPAWSDSPWGTGIRQVTRLAYEQRVWGIVGSIDGATTHLAEQVVAKARLPLVNPASTDKTVNLANVPWMFSCPPGDHQSAPLLARALTNTLVGRNFVLLTSTDHDSRAFTAELMSSLAGEPTHPLLHVQIHPGETDDSRVVAQISNVRPEAVVIVAAAADSARLVADLRGAGFEGAIFGGPAMGRWAFLEAAETTAEGVIFPLLIAGDKLTPFALEFEERYGHPPDYATVHSYDATQILIAAVLEAGLNRARIRDALVRLAPWGGASGTLSWDPLGQNQRPAQLGTINDGRVVPLAR
jgi:branched-chain amino acid transport system substrate-binding protein